MPKSSGSPATDYSFALLSEFAALGVRDVVLSPGSRSQALALAAAELEAAGVLRLRVRIDERVAGFLALGLAIETKTPVLVITTSGTAVANLHPAVLEAHHSGVPLIILSADRPEELRGIGSNQTTEQPGIFGFATQRSWDVAAPTGADGEREAAAAVARDVFTSALGPVQLNVAFTEPLSAAFTDDLRIEPHDLRIEPVEISPTDHAGEVSTLPLRGHTTHTIGTTHTITTGPRTVVVAGHGAGDTAEQLARDLDAVLVAEVSSGAHFGPNLVVAYRELLSEPGFGDLVERVIVFGHPTLSREVPALVQRADVESIVVRTPGVEAYNPGHSVTTFVDALTVEGTPADRAWVGRWVTTSRSMLELHEGPDIDIAISDAPRDQAAFGRAVLAGLRAPVTRRALVDGVWRMTWPHDRLVLAASRLIREADKVVPGKKIGVHANRGLAGIDGTIATALGIALASQDTAQKKPEDRSASGVTRVLLGDLALLHDVGSLLFGVGEPRPRIQVIVGNDGGGTIFDGLEVAGSAASERFDRVLLTQQQVDLEALATAYGWEYRRVTNRGELDAALTPSENPVLIEVPLPR